MRLVGTAQRLHRRLPTVGMLDERGSLIEKRQRRHVAVDEESEMDVEGDA